MTEERERRRSRTRGRVRVDQRVHGSLPPVTGYPRPYPPLPPLGRSPFKELPQWREPRGAAAWRAHDVVERDPVRFAEEAAVHVPPGATHLGAPFRSVVAHSKHLGRGRCGVLIESGAVDRSKEAGNLRLQTWVGSGRRRGMREGRTTTGQAVGRRRIFYLGTRN